MIQIKKPAQVPEKLAFEGKAETEKNKRLFEQFEEGFRSDERKFEFKNGIYGHESVKSTLKEAQHQKCCFCERKEEIGDVEHFRPKSAYQQNQGDKLSRPAYYWLAYEWDNLFFCCPKCNRSYKRNLFPLADDSERARSHSDDIHAEIPLFIHPEKENPEQFIEFIGTRPRAAGGNLRGKVTIEKTGINRPFLDEDRNRVYQELKMLHNILNSDDINDKLKDDIQKLLDKAVRDSAEFAAMIRCGHWFSSMG
ncbi:MAG: hypothetical protein DRI57_04870 [Deltaproteobacteria bacterium]|nr:MAG: hypothetical protein DRI57_04870 [Deltaproteobacteria bacterium]